MIQGSQKEYLLTIQTRYKKADRKEKIKILDEFCANCSYNRKYAIRLLKKIPAQMCIKKTGRPKKYYQEAIVNFLVKLWVALNLACSRKIKAAIPYWIEYSPTQLSEQQKQLLSSISFSTIDRILRKKRHRYKKLGLGTTKPGSLIRKQIPVATNQWDEHIPGYIEADTVAHCGMSVAGQFVYTLQIVDIATGWTESRGVWGKGEQGIFRALVAIEEALPFQIKGFDSDNGNEFLNYHLLRYFLNKKPKVKFTRSRPYEKNDNAHIEEKNWSLTRQHLGYQRFSDPAILPLLNDLYTTEWTLFFNYFVPSMKLIEKKRDGAIIRKIHDKPRTPFERLCQSKILKKADKKRLEEKITGVNPFQLQERLKEKILTILKLAIVEEPHVRKSRKGTQR